MDLKFSESISDVTTIDNPAKFCDISMPTAFLKWRFSKYQTSSLTISLNLGLLIDTSILEEFHSHTYCSSQDLQMQSEKAVP